MQELPVPTHGRHRIRSFPLRTWLYLACWWAMVLLLAACALFGSEAKPVEESVQIRAPRPTFTPTPGTAQGEAAAPGAGQPAVGNGNVQDPSTQQPANQPVAENAGQSARAIVNTPLVNARTGPGTDYEIVATVERGAEYEIIGKNPDGAWWQLCCIDGVTVWIIGEYIDTDGPVDAIPVSGGVGQGGSVAEQPAPQTTTGGGMSFDLKTQEQFPEAGVVRVFAYIYSGTDALPGYTLHISKDGTDLAVSVTSFGGQPAFTWPFQDARQRHQNLKIEFPGVEPAGIWQVQLIDSAGLPAGPAATFTLAANDPQQELYVRYEKR
jgi:hypothetical protein